MSETVHREFQIKVLSDGRVISVFTAPPVNEGRLTEVLTVAAGKIPGSVIGEAKSFIDEKGTVGRRPGTFGTGGTLRFSEPLKGEALNSAMQAVMDALSAAGFEFVEI